jgi:hypothetical protein
MSSEAGSDWAIRCSEYSNELASASRDNRSRARSRSRSASPERRRPNPATIETSRIIADQVAHCLNVVASASGAINSGRLTASDVTVPTRSAKPNPRANPAIVTEVISEKMSGDSQWPVMSMATTWIATSVTTWSSDDVSPV